MNELIKKIEGAFETFLFNMKFLTIIAVLGSLISSIIMFVKGSLLIINALMLFFGHFTFTVNANEVDHLLPLFVSSIDSYLFAMVLLIFSMGIYELFISDIDPAARTKDTRPNWLKIHSLDDLKGSLGKVILMILIVSFFEHSLGIKYTTAIDLLFLGVGILLVSGALFLTHAQKH